MKEISYLELEQDTSYYLILISTGVITTNEFIVQFKSYSFTNSKGVATTPRVNFTFEYDNSIIPTTVQFRNFTVGRAHIYSITEDEQTILEIK